MRFVIVSLLVLILAACESNPPAPVIERTPQSSKPKPPAPNKSIDVKTAASKDWRPDSHVVKKGDTLFSVSLEYGIYYKDIATANNIAPPYPIRIGQKLDLSGFKTKTAAVTNPADTGKATDDGVVVTPIKVEPVATGTATKPTTSGSAVTPILSEPKAMREAYSASAWNRAVTPQTATKTADAKSTDTKSETKPIEPTEAKPAEVKPTDDESLTWGWPTQGKVSAGFNEASNKGIDIAGNTGQAINAAAPGKVIYSGSDLRGYGKLVIIKHNKTYLSVYAHNSKIVVKEGQSIAAGQKIAEMGNTDTTSTKLHFEIRRLGKSVDPAKYLTQN
jgi:lipoprotein NlpD